MHLTFPEFLRSATLFFLFGLGLFSISFAEVSGSQELKESSKVQENSSGNQKNFEEEKAYDFTISSSLYQSFLPQFQRFSKKLDRLALFLNSRTGLKASSMEWIVNFLLVLIVLGVLLGLSGFIVVYEDATDLFLNFLLLAFPLLTAVFFYVFLKRVSDLSLIVVLGLECLILVLIFVKSLKSNAFNPFKVIFAFPTKIVLGVSFLLVFIGYLNNRGGRSRKDLGFRRIFSILIVLIAPFLLGLIRKKEDSFLQNALVRKL